VGCSKNLHNNAHRKNFKYHPLLEGHAIDQNKIKLLTSTLAILAYLIILLIHLLTIFIERGIEHLDVRFIISMLSAEPTIPYL